MIQSPMTPAAKPIKPNRATTELVGSTEVILYKGNKFYLEDSSTVKNDAAKARANKTDSTKVLPSRTDAAKGAATRTWKMKRKPNGKPTREEIINRGFAINKKCT